MKQFMLPTNTHMGAWFMPTKTINKVIKFWDKPEFQEYKVKGQAKTYGNNTLSTNDVKEATEIYINSQEVVEPWGEYLDCLQECLDDYLLQYPFANEVNAFDLELNFNFQHYPKGGGFKELHMENRGCEFSGRRHLVFMTYLNTIDNAGTEFPSQNIITPSIKGLTLIWPAYFTHPHKSQVCDKSEKMIVTGWYRF